MASNKNNRTSHPGSYTSRSLKQIRNPGLTPSGRDWLTRALDPFHDNVSVPKSGLPDFTPNATLIKEHTRSVTVTVPPTTATDQNWNCAIFTTPNLNVGDFYKAQEASNGNVQLNTTQDDLLTMDTVTIFAWPEANGSDWFLPGTNSDVVSGLVARGISLYENGSASVPHTLTRLIGGGFEVANTTSNLYKQGNVIICGAPQVIERDQIGGFEDQVNAITTGSPVYTCRLPPTSAEAVRANPNSVSWEAEHGCYVPFRMDHMKNPFSIQTSIPLNYQTSANAPQQVLISQCDVPFISGRFPNVQEKAHLAPLSQSVAFFTGLSYQTALTVNVRFLEEVAPISDLDLLSYGPEVYMADPLALELYQRALMLLPVGVTFAENASAEFWSKVVNTLGTIATPIAGMVGGPLASGAVSALTKGIVAGLDAKAIKQAAVAGKQQQKVANGKQKNSGKKK